MRTRNTAVAIAVLSLLVISGATYHAVATAPSEKAMPEPATLSQEYLEGSMQGKSGIALDLNGDGNGWRPQDSQLALSSKFVPMLSRLLDHMTGTVESDGDGFQVLQAIPLPLVSTAAGARQEAVPRVQITRPDGQVVSLPAGADRFRETDEPGIYRFQRGEAQFNFSVNLAPAESDTAPLGADHLEQLGVRIGRQPTHAEQMERQRQMRDTELESGQKLWRWLLVGVLGVLAVETLLAGQLTRRLARQTADGLMTEPII